MLLWLRYLKQLEGDAPPGGAGDFKTMCKICLHVATGYRRLFGNALFFMDLC